MGVLLCGIQGGGSRIRLLRRSLRGTRARGGLVSGLLGLGSGGLLRNRWMYGFGGSGGNFEFLAGGEPLGSRGGMLGISLRWG